MLLLLSSFTLLPLCQHRRCRHGWHPTAATTAGTPLLPPPPPPPSVGEQDDACWQQGWRASEGRGNEEGNYDGNEGGKQWWWRWRWWQEQWQRQQGCGVSDNKGNGDGNDCGGDEDGKQWGGQGCRASNNEGNGSGNNCGGNEGGKQQGGWGRQGDGDGDKVGRRATATVTKRAVAMATRVVGKDAMANSSTMVIFFSRVGGWCAPFFSLPCFILARKVCAKLCFCILCLLWMGSSTYHEIVGWQGMFLCFYVFFEN
jgi:hypothetical protein